MADNTTFRVMVERIPVVLSDGTTVAGEIGYTDGTDRRSLTAILPPHPNLGGALDNNVVEAVFEELASEHIAAKLSYRGMDDETGSGHYGLAYWDQLEAGGDYSLIVRDCVELLDYLRRDLGGVLEVRLFGYSFGAFIGLQLLNNVSDITAFAGITPPLPKYDFEEAAATARDACQDAVLLVGSREEPLSPAAVLSDFSRRHGLREMILDCDDHFFRGMESELARIIRCFLNDST